MGTIAGLLLLPITGPVRGFRFFLEQIRDEAEAVMFDEGRAFAELIDLGMRHNAGQLSDSDFIEQEEELLERLRSIRAYHEEQAQGDFDGDDDDFVELEPNTDGEAE